MVVGVDVYCFQSRVGNGRIVVVGFAVYDSSQSIANSREHYQFRHESIESVTVLTQPLMELWALGIVGIDIMWRIGHGAHGDGGI